jgi:hypothetical protein
MLVLKKKIQHPKIHDTVVVENVEEKLKEKAKEKLANIKKSTVEKPNANAALKDGVEQDVDNHKARFACIIIFSIYNGKD